MTTWTDLDAAQRRERVRDLINDVGASYREAAAALGTSRLAIAGVVYRARSDGEIIKRKILRKPVIKPAGSRSAGGVAATLQQKARRARAAAAAPAIPTVADRRPLRDRAWDALPGSTPVTADACTGCRWPIGSERPYLWCNLPTVDGRYCAEHTDMSRSPAWTAQQKGKL